MEAAGFGVYLRRLLEKQTENDGHINSQDLYEEWKLLIKLAGTIKDRKREVKLLLKRSGGGYRPLKEKSKSSERANEMAALYKQGKTLQEIANEYGVSRQYVNQTLQRIGLTGKDGGRALRPKQREQICKAEKCDRLANGSKGYCSKHYARISIHGTPTPEFKYKFKEHEEFCSVEGCNKKFRSHGYCNTHYHRWLKTGSHGAAEILPRGKHQNRGQQKGRRKLSESQVSEIRSLYVRGSAVSNKASEFSLTGLSKRYGVSPACIASIVKDKT